MVKLNNDNVKLWAHYLIERNRVYKKKEIEKLPSPWTDDKIIREFRFTNDFRWQDRETRWLIENIVKNDKLSYEDKLLNCILFRTWNKGKTFGIICGNGITTEKLINTPISEFRDTIEGYNRMDPDYVWYTNAFNCGGIKQSWKYPGLISEGGTYHYTQKKEIREEHPEHEIEKCIPLRMIYLIRQAYKDGIVDKIKSCKTARDVYDLLTQIHGIAGFLAYQIYVDFTYIEEFPFTEDNTVDAGPGCRRGLDYFFEDKDGMSYEECLYWVWEHQEELLKDYNLKEEFNYPLYYKGKHILSVHCCENSFCELSKYLKTYYETGRPKNKFKSMSINQKSLF